MMPPLSRQAAPDAPLSSEQFRADLARRIALALDDYAGALADLERAGHGEVGITLRLHGGDWQLERVTVTATRLLANEARC